MKMPAHVWRAAAIIVVGALASTLFLALAARPTLSLDQNGSWFLGHEMVQAARDVILNLFGQGTPVAPKTAEEIAADHDFHAWAANRSPAYSLFFYLTERIGTLWFMTFAQALAAVAAAYALWRLAAPNASLSNFAAVIAAIAVLTPLPFVAGYGNADLFAACAILLATIAVLYFPRVQRGWRIVSFLLLAFFVASHSGTGLIVAAVAAVGALILILFRASARSIAVRVGFIGGACVVGFLVDPIYGAIYHANTGGSFRKPPFLTARVLADGPGREYLRHACDQGAEYALCAYRHLPLTNADDVLWSNDPARGVYILQDAEGRKRLLDEQSRFLMGVIAHDPIGVVGAALTNSFDQLATFNVNWMFDNQFVWMDEQYVGTFMRDGTARAGGCDSSEACAPRFSASAIATTHALFVAAAFLATAFLLWQLWRQRDKSKLGENDQDLLLAAVVLLVVGILVNAAVCGAFSGVHARYQARVIWLLPFAAALLAAQPNFASTLQRLFRQAP